MARMTNPLKLQLWKDRLAAFRASSESVAVFCKKLPCSVNSFYAWKRKIENGPKAKNVSYARQKQSHKPSAFLPVVLRSTPELCVSIELPDGTAIRVPCEATDAIRIVLERVA